MSAVVTAAKPTCAAAYTANARPGLKALARAIMHKARSTPPPAPPMARAVRSEAKSALAAVAMFPTTMTHRPTTARVRNVHRGEAHRNSPVPATCANNSVAATKPA